MTLSLVRILLEMNTPDDPVWVYLDSQHKYILGHLQESYEASVKLISGKIFSIVQVLSGPQKNFSRGEEQSKGIIARCRKHGQGFEYVYRCHRFPEH